MLDMRAAMSWTKKNIGAWGGDGGRVTIFGESSGASAIQLHLLMRGSDGKYDRAISESGVHKDPCREFLK